jgi:hypothetical protein
LPDDEKDLTLVSADPARLKQTKVKNSASLFVNTIIYSPHLLEYPNTEPDGTMYVVPVEGLTDEERKAPWETVRNQFRSDSELTCN